MILKMGGNTNPKTRHCPHNQNHNVVNPLVPVKEIVRQRLENVRNYASEIRLTDLLT